MRTAIPPRLVPATAWLIFSFGVLIAGRSMLNLTLSELQTLIFVMLVFSGQANVYLVRERRHLWSSRPSKWLAVSTVVDVIIVSLLASNGLLMTGIPATLVIGLLLTTLLYILVLDQVKVAAFGHLSTQPHG